jgi:microcompartment protein CcmK/EutM
MRIGKVTGRVTLNRAYPTLLGGRFVIVEIQDRFALAGKPAQKKETLVCYDHMGAHQGDLISISESREACMPFYPEKIVPLDAYCAAILDHAEVSREIA